MRRVEFWLRRAVVDVSAALFPGACRGCGRPLPQASPPPHTAGARQRDAVLWDGRLQRALPWSAAIPYWVACPACAATLRPAGDKTPFAGTAGCVTAFAPTPLLFTLVHAFKYEAQIQLADWFAARLAIVARARLGHGLVLLPVPSHPARVRERGFDASAVLATAVARRLGAAVAPAVIVRRRATPPQARLAHAARAANVAGAFACCGRLPHARRIIVLDDIVTTGATVNALRAVLARPDDGIAVLALCRARDPGVRDAAPV
jgi:predicted amidophosphoribosyltransferase